VLTSKWGGQLTLIIRNKKEVTHGICNSRFWNNNSGCRTGSQEPSAKTMQNGSKITAAFRAWSTLRGNAAIAWAEKNQLSPAAQVPVGVATAVTEFMPSA